MQIALLCCYPILLHIAIAADLPSLRVFAVLVLTIGILYKGLLGKKRSAWLILISVAAITLVASQLDHWIYAFYLPPIILTAAFAAVFIVSLLPGNKPIVTAIGTKARGTLSEPMQRYTKGVTITWAVLLSAMTVWSAVLPWLASELTWSLFTNFINYILIAVLFVGEFLFRQTIFRSHDHPSFRQYLNIVLKSDNIKPQL